MSARKSAFREVRRKFRKLCARSACLFAQHRVVISSTYRKKRLRVCGEKLAVELGMTLDEGSPPRVRGKGYNDFLNGCNERITPASTPCSARKSAFREGASQIPKTLRPRSLPFRAAPRRYQLDVPEVTPSLQLLVPHEKALSGRGLGRRLSQKGGLPSVIPVPFRPCGIAALRRRVWTGYRRLRPGRRWCGQAS